MSLRRSAIRRFESRLRRYWQHFELEACLQVRARGYRIVFDFANVIDHYPTSATFVAGREGALAVKVFNSAYNHAFVLGKHLTGWKRVVCLAYLLGVGSVGARACGLSGRSAAVREPPAGAVHPPAHVAGPVRGLAGRGPGALRGAAAGRLRLSRRRPGKRCGVIASPTHDPAPVAPAPATVCGSPMSCMTTTAASGTAATSPSWPAGSSGTTRCTSTPTRSRSLTRNV